MSYSYRRCRDTSPRQSVCHGPLSFDRSVPFSLRSSHRISHLVFGIDAMSYSGSPSATSSLSLSVCFLVSLAPCRIRNTSLAPPDSVSTIASLLFWCTPVLATRCTFFAARFRGLERNDYAAHVVDCEPFFADSDPYHPCASEFEWNQ